jgi:hypothetical protein
MLYVVDCLAAVFFLVGFHLAFRQRALRAWLGRLLPAARRTTVENAAPSGDEEGVASVLRMIGVMVMAFSLTSAAFGNLIAHYAATGVN